MRIWHEKLIPKLCQKHLCAMWREGLGCYKIISEHRTDLNYWKHPATQEFVDGIEMLWSRLYNIREEMLKRGYNPKEMPKFLSDDLCNCKVKEWQTLEQQIEILKAKGCKCNV